IDHAAFLGTINPDTNKIPKHLFQGYLNIYNNYFKAPWMPDRTEANPNELNQDDARYGFRCCHLKNIWTAPLPPETELSRIRLRSLRLLRVSGIVMRLRMFLLLITFLKASHSFRNRLLVICKNAYLFATMIMTSVSSPFSCCSGIVRLNLM